MNNTTSQNTSPAPSPSIKTAGVGVARAKEIRTYVAQNSVTSPNAHRAVLSPISPNIRTR